MPRDQRDDSDDLIVPRGLLVIVGFLVLCFLATVAACTMSAWRAVLR